MKATQQTAAPVWINSNGEAVCRMHAGFYLRSQITDSPNQRSYDTPIDRWVREDSGEVPCETCALPVRPTKRRFSSALRLARDGLDTKRSAARNAIHTYGRARAASDFTLGSGLPADKVVSGMQATVRAYESVTAKVTLGLDPSVSARTAFDAISAFSSSLFEYGSRRHAGEGPDAADEVFAALDALLALGREQR